MLGNFLLALLIMVCYFCFLVSRDSEKERSEKTACEHLSYDKSSNTLTLRSRSSENTNVIKIEKRMISAYTYHPSQTIYTGATSGSVHMGGFHTESEYYSRQSQSSGKYELTYNGISLKDKYCPIDKIKLADPSLIQAAKANSTVRRFLKDNGTLVLSHESTSQQDLGYLKYMDTAAAMGAISLLSAERALTKSECQAIKDWMSTDSNDKELVARSEARAQEARKKEEERQAYIRAREAQKEEKPQS